MSHGKRHCQCKKQQVRGHTMFPLVLKYLTRKCLAGCVIGVDYPKPIVDHATVHKINMGRMKAAYDRKLYGTPASTGATHPLSPALRQVGSACGNDADESADGGEPCPEALVGAASARRHSSSQATTSARKKSRLK